jgi:hypothetical protein
MLAVIKLKELLVVVIATILAGLLAIMFAISGKRVLGGDDEEFNISNDPDFIEAPYMNEDSTYIEEGPFIADDKQEYLSRDYSRIMFSRFPMFRDGNDMAEWDGTPRETNDILRTALSKGRGKHWTNQTLSYMRNRKSFEVIYDDIIRRECIDITNVVDATGNLGGDAISFAMLPEVKHVKVYEILPNVFKLLRNNIELYKLNDKIEAIDGRFDYNVPNGSLVMIDVPYEKGNNAGDDEKPHFNLSIDTMPIGAVCNKVLDAGAANVLITVPRDYKYNLRFAQDTNQEVVVFRTHKNVKIYLVRKNKK